MTHEERVLKHEYSLEGIHEHAERIASLEELVLDMLLTDVEQHWCELAERARALGIEVEL